MLNADGEAMSAGVVEKTLRVQSEKISWAIRAQQTIANFEAGRSLATNNHIAVEVALTRAGIELIDPNGGWLGVRFRDRDRRDKSNAHESDGHSEAADS